MTSLPHGGCPTPLVSLPRLASRLGLPELLVKIESALPISHTFKDRGAFTAVKEAVSARAPAILAATCGNMGTAVAGAAALLGMPSLIVLSAEAPALTQQMIHAFATRVWLVRGRFDDLDQLVRDITEKFPRVACINTTLNSSFRQGFRSLMRELLGQLDPKRKYAVCVPTADGTLLAACHEEYLARSQQRDCPTIRFVLCQPAGCAPLVRAHLNNQPVERWAEGDTAVLPLSVREPFFHGRDALEALQHTHGTAVAVPEEKVADFARLFASHAGMFSDLVGGVLVGALEDLERRRWFRHDEVPVGIYTGNGMVAAELKASVPLGPVYDLAARREIEGEILSWLRTAEREVAPIE